MSERSKRGTAKGAPQASAKIQKGNSDRKTGEDASEDIEAAPPKKQRRTSAQQTIEAAEAWQQEGEGATQGDGRRSSKRTAWFEC